MKKRANEFAPRWITSSSHLEEVIKQNLQGKDTHYYLFCSDWDVPSNYFYNKLSELENTGSQKIVNVVSIFDVPNGLGILKSAIKDFRETVSTAQIDNYTKVPMLVRVHGAFPVVVDYNGSIGAELGL